VCSPVIRSVRLLTLNFKWGVRLVAGARLVQVQLNASLPRCAAALLGILDAAQRTLSGFFRGGKRKLRDLI
jgi:hypothetical protein